MYHLKSFFAGISICLTLLGFGQTPKKIKKTTTINTEPRSNDTQKKSYDPDFFLLIDSTLGEWNNPGKRIELKSYKYYEFGNLLKSIAIDSIGIPYAIGTINRNEIYGEHVFRFINNEWQVFEQNISEPIECLINSGNGIIYGLSKNKIYRAAENKWETVFTGSFKNYNVLAGYDGNIYIREQVRKKDRLLTSISKLTNGRLDIFMDKGKPLDNDFDVYSNLYIDRNGLLYKYNRKQQRVETWNGQQWNYTDSIDLDVDNFWSFDNNNNLFIASKRMFENLNVFRLEGTTWKPLTVPDSIGKKNNYWKLIPDIAGKVYLQFDIEFEEANLYLLNGDKFENMGKQPKRGLTSQGIKTFLIAGDKFFAISEDNVYQGDNYYKKLSELIYYNPVWKVKVRKMAHIPNFEIVSEPYMKEYKNLNKCYLFEDNGKYGVQTLQGRIIAGANFDKIYVGYTPSYLLELKGEEFLHAFGTFYCYTLIQGNDTLYSYIGNYDSELPDEGTLAMFKIKVSSTCNYCKGKGTIEAHRETITVKGEWVPPSGGSSFTSTTYEKRWDGILGRYVTYINTKTTNVGGSRGHYKPDTQKTINVPERKCDRCEGSAKRYSYQIYKFNYSNKTYTMTWN